MIAEFEEEQVFKIENSEELEVFGWERVVRARGKWVMFSERDWGEKKEGRRKRGGGGGSQEVIERNGRFGVESKERDGVDTD